MVSELSPRARKEAPKRPKMIPKGLLVALAKLLVTKSAAVQTCTYERVADGVGKEAWILSWR